MTVIDYKEVKKMLGVSKAQVFSLCKRNKIKYFRISTSIRFYREEIEEFININKNKT